MNRGTVRWFSSEQGFGIITSDINRANFFVHYSAIVSDDFQSLAEGQKVTYDMERDAINSSKVKAVNVCVA